MIVKCQRGITAGYRNQMLFYTQHREQLAEFKLLPEWLSLFERYGPKFYAEVYWPSSHVLPVFIAKVDDQDWRKKYVTIVRKP